MHRLQPGGAQDRLAQPLQAEDQQQPADDDAQHVDRQRGERRAERHDQHRQSHNAGEDAQQSRRPAPRRADREHDRQRLDGLDRAGEEHRDRQAGLRPTHRPRSPFEPPSDPGPPAFPAGETTGSVTVTVDRSAWTLPPWRSAVALTIASPMPEPVRRAPPRRAKSARTPPPRCRAGKPLPSSVTATLTRQSATSQGDLDPAAARAVDGRVLDQVVEKLRASASGSPKTVASACDPKRPRPGAPALTSARVLLEPDRLLRAACLRSRARARAGRRPGGADARRRSGGRRSPPRRPRDGRGTRRCRSGEVQRRAQLVAGVGEETPFALTRLLEGGEHAR